MRKWLKKIYDNRYRILQLFVLFFIVVDLYILLHHLSFEEEVTTKLDFIANLVLYGLLEFEIRFSTQK
jgi:hypothetical protein